MGYDIHIRKYYLNYSDQTFQKGEIKEESISISYNWSDYSSICPNNFFIDGHQCSPHCQTEPLWHVKEDLHCRQGQWIALRIERVLKRLRKLGCRMDVKPGNDDDWYWGLDKEGKQLPASQRYEPFIFLLRRIHYLALLYPKCFFIGDHESVTTLHSLSGIKFYKTREEFQTKDLSPWWHSYNHPLKGVLKIETFKQAMSVFGFLSAYVNSSNDDGTDVWFQHATTLL